MSKGQLVHTITANHEPFRLVLADQRDRWDATIDQVNARRYDHVKLHRITTNLDVGLAPLSLIVCFDGTLMLPALVEFDDEQTALRLFNRTLAELLLGGLYCEATTSHDLGKGELYRNGYGRVTSWGGGPSSSFHAAARMQYLGPMDWVRLVEPELVYADDMRESLARGRRLVGLVESLPLEQLLYGCTFFARRQWSEALIHFWTITERLLELAWRKHVVAPRHPAKKERDFLEDHRTWTAAAKLLVLSEKALLPRQLQGGLDAVRRARNDFVHNGTEPSRLVASEGLRLMFELASLCATDFKASSVFDRAVTAIDQRASAPKPRGSKFWLPIPPIPGDPSWTGAFEQRPELALVPVPFGSGKGVKSQRKTTT